MLRESMLCSGGREPHVLQKGTSWQQSGSLQSWPRLQLVSCLSCAMSAPAHAGECQWKLAVAISSRSVQDQSHRSWLWQDGVKDKWLETSAEMQPVATTSGGWSRPDAGHQAVQGIHSPTLGTFKLLWLSMAAFFGFCCAEAGEAGGQPCPISRQEGRHDWINVQFRYIEGGGDYKSRSGLDGKN